MAEKFESGEYDSTQWRAAAPVSAPRTPSALEAALRYWPGRWPCAVVAGVLAQERYLREMSPAEWTALLDARAAALLSSGILADDRPFL